MVAHPAPADEKQRHMRDSTDGAWFTRPPLAILRPALIASDAGDWELRRLFKELAVLTSSVCRELQREDVSGDIATSRSQAAYGLLMRWMRETYGLPANRDVDFRYGLDDPRPREVAFDLLNELKAGAEVCEALSMVYSAGVRLEFERDIATLRKRLNAFLSHAD